MKRTLIGIIIFLILVIIIGIIKIYYNELTKEEYTAISTYNNPVVPEGFKAVETERASWEKQEDGTIKGWNNGLVIEDSIGNQFVWVPIDLENLNYNSYYVADKFQYKKEGLDIKNIDDAQILKYGGFYVARYEAGIPKEKQDNIDNIDISTTNNVLETPRSQKGVIPWNYISLKNAKLNAENMYQTANVKSNLLTEKQWKAMMQWIGNCGYDIYKESKSWGNYSNVNFKFSGYYSKDHGKTYQYGEEKLKTEYNMILSCGATERNMANNIYDLAGNLSEYIDSYSTTGDYSVVGGNYDYIATGAYSGGSYANISNQIGFRVALSIL